MTLPTIKDICRTNSPQPMLDAFRILLPALQEMETNVNALLKEVITNVTIVRNGTDDAIIQLTKESGETLQSPAYGIEMWEDLDLSNLPTNFAEGQELMITLNQTAVESVATNWTTALGTNPEMSVHTLKPTIRMMLNSTTTNGTILSSIKIGTSAISGVEFMLEDVGYLNNTTETTTMFQLLPWAFNGAGLREGTGVSVSRSNITTYVESIKRRL